MFTGIIHNLKLSLRLLARSKVYTTINLTGLVLGLTASFILLIFAINELGYNDCYMEAHRMFRVIHRDKNGIRVATGSFSTKTLLTDHFSTIEQAARVVNLNYLIGNVSVKYNSVYQDVPGFFCADAELTDILRLRFIGKTSPSLLKQPGHIIISDRAAQKYFGTISPAGKTLQVKINNQVSDLIVSGVFETLPWNSTFQADVVAPIGFYRQVLRNAYNDSTAELSSVNDYETYILLQKNSRISSIEAQMANFYHSAKVEQGSLGFQNFKDVYLHSKDIQNDFISKGSEDNLVIYLSLSLFILILASINNSMLGAARSSLRFKEIGIRKVLGATKSNLRNQLLTESVLLIILAFPLSFLLIGLIEPVVKQYFGYSIHLDSGNILLYLCVSSAISIAIGLISGLYVALYLSALDPITALKSNYLIYKKVSFSKAFIVFQVFVTLALFIVLINVYLQIRLCLDNGQGINRQNLFITSFNSSDDKTYRSMKEAVEKHDFVSSVSGSSIQIPANDYRQIKISVPAKNNEPIIFEMLSTDYDFLKTIGAEMISGRDFSPDIPADSASTIINEEAARQIGYKESVNSRIGPYKIIGVVKDFNIHSLHHKIIPMLVKLQPQACNTMMIRYKTGNEEQLLDVVNKKWARIAPDIPLVYHLFDTEMKALYNKEQNFGRVVATFNILAFIITGMGLFGLAMLIVERRMKEMSIRKVYGASPGSIIYLIQKEFIAYILIATGFSIPFAWYFLSLWLNQFYYRINPHWYIFLLAVMVIGIFVSLILFLKTLRLLRESPAHVLKYE